MGTTFCIANQKGGVGKTTTAINLAIALAKTGGRTLLVDLDPQCSATTGLGHEPLSRHPLVSEKPISESRAAVNGHSLDLLPGSRHYHDAESIENDEPKDLKMVQAQLLAAQSEYDYVVFDCPPSVGKITEIALRASTEVIMPIQCEYFAMEGLAEMIRVIGKIMRSGESCLQFGGILLTMVDPSLELTREVDAEVREFFGDIVFQTVIPRDAAVAEAPSHGQSVIEYAPRSRGTRAYVELCMEVLGRDEIETTGTRTRSTAGATD